MVTVKKLYVFSACVLSLSAVFFTTFAISTNHWVYSDTASFNNDIDNTNGKPVIKYGLFAGTFKRTWGVEGTMPIYMTCLIKENVCAYLCANSPDARYDLLRDLYNNINVTEPMCVTVGLRSQNFHPSVTRNLEAQDINKKFINCGVWVSTIFFLIVSMLFGSIASFLSMYNTFSNPVKTYCSIYGIYISNGVALFTVILAMLFWGIEYHKSIFHNMAVFYTLNGPVNSDKTAQLGYSYWLILCSIVLYIASIGVLYIRQYLVSKDPGQQIVERDESGDPVIYLY